jgi:hypothetical protein
MRVLFLLMLFLTSSAQACAPAKIEAAAELVLQMNPVLQAERRELDEQSRQRDWRARLSLGYATGSTEIGESTSPNASIQLDIPLFDRSRELKLARAHTIIQLKQDSILSGFLGGVEKLCSQAEQVRALEALRSFYRDKLQYHREQVKEGLEEAAVLWEALEKVQRVEQDHRRELGELVAMKIAIARRFGGEAWKQLQVLLVEVSS